MGYTALYRKFRPDTFADVKGQDHIVKTLKNQIQAERIGHAYLFCGTRGTGKTSVAKIFARAVNCEHPVDGSPCNECAACRAIAGGASMNVIEIDAASNNGVDNIREIREEVSYSPAQGKYKVYIIDEVHMLSIGAFNALLKTLEEPPSYVIFILATTEAHKIPVTILSRCQRYDFKRISQETILARLQELMEKEHVDVEEKALRYIAKKGDGAMRDALSLLDQCIAFYLGETLTYDKVLEVLGAVDTDVYSDLLRKLLAEDIVGAISTLEELIMRGADLLQFVNDFTWYLRNLMLLKASEDMEDVLDVSTENLKQLRQEAAMVRSDTLMRYIRIFSELSNTIRNSTNRRVLVEMAMIKLCKPESERDELSLVERIRKLEHRLEQLGSWPGGGYPGIPRGYAGISNGGYPGAVGGSYTEGQQGSSTDEAYPSEADYYSAMAAMQPGDDYSGEPGTQFAGDYSGGAGASSDVYSSTPGMHPVPGVSGIQVGNFNPAQGNPAGGYGTVAPVSMPYQKAVPEDLKQVKAMWKVIISETSGRFKILLSSAEVKFNVQDPNDNRLYVVFADFLAERYLHNSERKKELEQIIAEKIGKQVEVKFILAADEGIQKAPLGRIDIDERIREFIHAEVEIEDED